MGGAGVGVTSASNHTLLITPITPEQRVASFAPGRAAQNLRLGLGAAIAGFAMSSAHDLRSFQALYLFDAITYAALALVVLAVIPNQRAGADTGSGEGGFREPRGRNRWQPVLLPPAVRQRSISGRGNSSEGALSRRCRRRESNPHRVAPAGF
jgi:hypothetical protein